MSDAQTVGQTVIARGAGALATARGTLQERGGLLATLAALLLAVGGVAWASRRIPRG